MLLEAGGTPQSLPGLGLPVWSPDGQFIVTTSSSGAGDLVIIDRDGTIVTTIEDAGGDPSWQRQPG
jgi:hypothetical protein